MDIARPDFEKSHEPCQEMPVRSSMHMLTNCWYLNTSVLTSLVTEEQRTCAPGPVYVLNT